MKKENSLKTLKHVVFAGGIFDLIGAIYFSVLVGVNRSISSPATHSFYAMMIASFLFSLACMQIITSFNLKRYTINIGIVIISRSLYVVIFFAYFLSTKDFPITFLPTAIADFLWTLSYIALIYKSDSISIKELMIPKVD